MAVYVDNAQIPYGRMLMSHMLADTREELFAMADAIGLDRRHVQHLGQSNEHFDISKGYRTKALAKGAVELDRRGLAKLIRKRRDPDALRDYQNSKAPPVRRRVFGRASDEQADQPE